MLRPLWIRSTAAIAIAPAGLGAGGGIVTSEETSGPLPAARGEERDTGIVSGDAVNSSASGAGANFRK
ncbi:MAG TPA: hypothetical protein VFX46_03675 [Hyphomicrobiaceae bacterium]|nr:hypothetical protein [Hyphomicrobiaceae bacterium]